MELLEKDLTGKIINACFEVSNELGVGFLESVYEKALIIALADKNIDATAQAPPKVLFRDKVVGDFYADILRREQGNCRIESGQSMKLR